MNLTTFDHLVLLLNQVPHIAQMYERKDSSRFVQSVREWIDASETILTANRIHLAAELATLKIMLTSAQRGERRHDKSSDGTLRSKKKAVEGASIDALHQAQNSIRALLAPYESRYDEASQAARKMLIVASSLGMLNARLRGKFDPAATIPALWADMVSNEKTAPMAVQVLELVPLDEAHILVHRLIDELIADHARISQRQTGRE